MTSNANHDQTAPQEQSGHGLRCLLFHSVRHCGLESVTFTIIVRLLLWRWNCIENEMRSNYNPVENNDLLKLNPTQFLFHHVLNRERVERKMDIG